MDSIVRADIEQALETGIASLAPVSGGDINAAYRVTTDNGQAFFLKYHRGSTGKELLQAERAGLEAIRATGAISTPGVIAHGGSDQYGWLLLEFLQTETPEKTDWEVFGRNLAQLHRVTASSFGFDRNNFIGTLVQSNARHATWAAFYAEERLLPQFRMAKSWFSDGDWVRIERFVAAIPDLVDPGIPSLIHGDLWGGNFLIASDGPVLIDPAVCFAHREMDLAMSRLFGGFDARFYSAYQEEWPLAPGGEERVRIYQLYYLLAHLNMFGAGYLGSVTQIVHKFTK